MFAKSKVSQSMIDAVNKVLGEQPVEQKEQLLNEAGAPIKEPTPTGVRVYGSSYGNSAKAKKDQTKSPVDDLKGPKDKEMKEAAKPDFLDMDKDGNKKESMKKGKVLFISFTDKTRGVSYHDYLKSKLDCTFCLWTDLIFQQNKILIGNTDVNTFDFIFIGVVSKYPNYFVTLENYIKKYKIPYFKYGCSPERNNKILQNSLTNGGQKSFAAANYVLKNRDEKYRDLFKNENNT